jgi:hypothetical protein
VASPYNYQPEKYQLLARVGGDKIVAFRAVETNTGLPVLLHQFMPGLDHSEVLRLVARFLVRKQAGTGQILDVLNLDGSEYLVTTDKPECLSLREWLEWELRGGEGAVRGAGSYGLLDDPPSAPSLRPTGNAAPPTEPGEFTRKFGPVARSDSAPQTESHAPGEFTRAFEGFTQSQAPLPVWPAVSAGTPPSLPKPLPVEDNPFSRQGAIFPNLKDEPERAPLPEPPIRERNAELAENPGQRVTPANLGSAGASPSPYTQVIQRSSLRQPQPEGSTPAPQTPAPAVQLNVSAPALPQVAPPPIPAMAPLAVPQISAPALPAPVTFSTNIPPSGHGPAGSKVLLILFGAVLFAALLLIGFLIFRNIR